MVPLTPPVVAPPPVLRPDWKNLARLASKQNKPPDLDVCPTPSSLHQFCGTTDKPKAAWFWCPNQETVTVILMPKLPTRSYWFWGPNWKTRASGFEAKPEKTVVTSFEAKPEITVRVVLRPNHSQIVDLGFKAQPRNLRSSSPRARCRPSTVLCIRSPTPAMILVAARHVAPATCTPRDKLTRFSKRNRDKGKTTKMSSIRIQTSASQWLITIKPRNWPLAFSISSLMSPLTTKVQSLNLESETLWSTTRRPKTNKKLKNII
jgi:hypothetical protein